MKSGERIINYRERLKLHRRFYLPAFFVLVFAYPGSLGILRITSLSGAEFWEHMVSLLLITILIAGYFILIVVPKKLHFKLSLGFLLTNFCIILFTMRVRDADQDSINGLFNPIFFAPWIPLGFVYVTLCALDPVKRSRWVVSGVSVAALFLAVINFYTLPYVGSLDTMIWRDVLHRLKNSEYDSPQVLVRECQRIAVQEQRSQCEQMTIPILHATICSPIDDKESQEEYVECMSNDTRWKQKQPKNFDPVQARIGN